MKSCFNIYKIKLTKQYQPKCNTHVIFHLHNPEFPKTAQEQDQPELYVYFVLEFKTYNLSKAKWRIPQSHNLEVWITKACPKLFTKKYSALYDRNEISKYDPIKISKIALKIFCITYSFVRNNTFISTGSLSVVLN